MTVPSLDPAVAMNGSLTGRLVTTGDFPHRNALLSFDFATATYSLIEGADAPDTIRGLDNEVTSRFFTVDHSEPGRFVETQYNCLGQEDLRCVAFWSAGGVLESAVSTRESVLPGTSMAKRSRDGRFFAQTNRDRRFLEIRNTAGDLLSETEYQRQFKSPYDWLPDNSIIIENDTDGDPFDGIIRLVRTAPNSTELSSVIDLPARYSGRVRSLVVDPSGTRIAMLVRLTNDDSNDQRPIVLDVLTGAVYEPVAFDAASEGLDAVALHWSPDGQYLIFQNPSFRPLLTPLPVGNRPGQGLPANVTYVVRADGGSYTLPSSVAESNDDARVVIARPKDDPSGAPAARNAEPGYVWVP